MSSSPTAANQERQGYMVVQFLPDASQARVLPLGIMSFHALQDQWKLAFEREDGALALAREEAMSEGQRYALKDIHAFLARGIQLVLQEQHPRTIDELMGKLAELIGFNFFLSDIFDNEPAARTLQENLYARLAQRGPRPLFDRPLVPA